jgi:uncharacterized RDD family membrane protein YckC
MSAASNDRRQRTLVTAEGLALPLTVASRAARAGALILDLTILFTGMIVFLLAAIWIFGGMLADDQATGNPALELVTVVLIMALFLLRYGWFLWFELGPRGATPGKRALGIRVAARPSTGDGTQRLTAEAVLARNLMRDVEVFIPAVFLATGGYADGIVGTATLAWMAVFLLFPFFNRDGLRAGDLVAGTWVVEATSARLPEVLSTSEDRSATYRFGEAELAVYGARELQVLEKVLREDRTDAMRQVMEAICRKIGWEPGAGDERAFLETFYAALRAKLERDLRFGKRKQDKFG